MMCEDCTLVDLVEAGRALPYGRPSDRTAQGMLRKRRGTCSTKHLFLAQAIAKRFPETEPQIVHRVYELDRSRGSCTTRGSSVPTCPPVCRRSARKGFPLRDGLGAR